MPQFNVVNNTNSKQKSIRVIRISVVKKITSLYGISVTVYYY